MTEAATTLTRAAQHSLLHISAGLVTATAVGNFGGDGLLVSDNTQRLTVTDFRPTMPAQSTVMARRIKCLICVFQLPVHTASRKCRKTTLRRLTVKPCLFWAYR
jgi:hypothetical protein